MKSSAHRGKKQPDSKESLTPAQRQAYDMVVAGTSIFLTGGAGSGKSFLLRAIIEGLPREKTGVTASTGSAATLIGGVTIHSFAGLGLAKQPATELAKAVAKKWKVAGRIRAIRWLIIDEVSMVSAGLLDKLDAVFRAVRNNTKPMGGVCLILCGDFLQLPPVPEDGEAQRFAFQSDVWAALGLRWVELQGSHRQRDAAFVQLLEEMRWGRCDPTMATVLRERCVAERPAAGEALVTYLMSHRNDADHENQRQLAVINSLPHEYPAVDTVKPDAPSGILEKMLAPANLRLKVGAQVMLLVNLNTTIGLVNGAIGRVVAFDENKPHFPLVEFPSAGGTKMWIDPMPFVVEVRGQVVASRTQLPLMLAWAISIHKSQGKTLQTKTVVDLGRTIFEAGQAYVAASRLARLEDLLLTSFDPKVIRAHPTVVAWMVEQRRLNSTE